MSDLQTIEEYKEYTKNLNMIISYALDEVKGIQRTINYHPTGLLLQCRQLFNAKTALEKKVNRLQAIVDKLPKTADGVPVMPGMAVFTSLPLHAQEIRSVVEVEVGRVSKDTIWGREPIADALLPYLPEYAYSTREAAEAAKESG